jgi:hypothetical protein
MKVKEYLPLYSRLRIEKFHIYIDGQFIALSELYDDLDEYGLNDYQIKELETFDIFGLQDALKDEYFTPQTVTPYLRELFDRYKDNDGEPMYWINRTLDSVLLNSGSYKPEIRTEIEKFLFNLRDIYLKIKQPQSKKQPLNLEDIFSNKRHLDSLVKVLEEKKFITIENGSPRWTGINHDKARGKGLQLVVLSEVCRPKYKRDNYQAKELNEAWTEYFNYKMSPVKWQPGGRPADGSVYHQLFRNILQSI